MQISHATRPSPTPGRVNEDLVVSGPGWAFVLDGATPAPGAATGCRHDVPWLVRRLARALATRLTLTAAERPLPEILAGAIGELRDAHAGACDLGNPDSPSSTAAIARAGGTTLDYLVLCDSPILLRHTGGRLTVVADDRLARLPGGPPYASELIRARRNQPGGFWVASTDPTAAYQAVCGQAELTELTDAALFTDGVTRLAEWYGYPWPVILDYLRDQGPDALIDLVRAAERGYPHPRHKQHDDATVAHLRWPSKPR
ncbi:MAG: protein phosphatase 2C domain-containing protein [Streptosporangiaceae bacterium]